MKNLLIILALAIASGLACDLGKLAESGQKPEEKSADKPAVKKEETPDEAIRAVYAKIDRATKNKDETELFSYASDDYTIKDVKGKVSSREAAIKQAKENFKAFTEISEAKSDVFRVEEKDGLWNASVTSIMAGKIKGPDGKIHTFESNDDSDDQWAKSASGQWKCIRSITRRSTTKIDGKEVK